MLCCVTVNRRCELSQMRRCCSNQERRNRNGSCTGSRHLGSCCAEQRSTWTEGMQHMGTTLITVHTAHTKSWTAARRSHRDPTRTRSRWGCVDSIISSIPMQQMSMNAPTLKSPKPAVLANGGTEVSGHESQFYRFNSPLFNRRLKPHHVHSVVCLDAFDDLVSRILVFGDYRRDGGTRVHDPSGPCKYHACASVRSSIGC